MVRVHVADHNCIHIFRCADAEQVRERARSEIGHDRCAAALDEISAASPPRARNSVAGAQHGDAETRIVNRAPHNLASTSSACPSTDTFGQTCTIFPLGSIKNVERWMPMLFLPYMFFSTITPNASHSFESTSASSVNGMPCFSLNF